MNDRTISEEKYQDLLACARSMKSLDRDHEEYWQAFIDRLIKAYVAAENHSSLCRPLDMQEATRTFIHSLLCLRDLGATIENLNFIVGNTGATMAFCERMVDLRECGIDEFVIEDFLKNTIDVYLKGE